MDPLPLAQARDLGSFLAPKARGEKWVRQMEGLRRVRELLHPPSRIAVLGGTDGDGFGFVFRTLDIGEITTPGARAAGPSTTINDVLVAALHLTVQSWNTTHDVATDRVGVQMPINVRPADRSWDVVSNLASMISVSTSPTIERTWQRPLQRWPSRPARCDVTTVPTVCTTSSERPRMHR